MLEDKANRAVDVHAGPGYHEILYAWRVRRGDFRGAAAVLFQRLERTERSDHGGRSTRDDGLLEGYLVLINLLTCVEKGGAWVLAAGGGEGEKAKRRVVTLEDVRRGYQEELDRRSVLESGRFAFVGGGEEMDLL